MNINQLLNSSLKTLTEGDDDEVPQKTYPSDPEEQFANVNKNEKSPYDPFWKKSLQGLETAKTMVSQKTGKAVDWITKNPGTASAATLAALGAGLGAVALAKKLRAKKAQVKK